jgi:hypothetical protein
MVYGANRRRRGADYHKDNPGVERERGRQEQRNEADLERGRAALGFC